MFWFFEQNQTHVGVGRVFVPIQGYGMARVAHVGAEANKDGIVNFQGKGQKSTRRGRAARQGGRRFVVRVCPTHGLCPASETDNLIDSLETKEKTTAIESISI